MNLKKKPIITHTEILSLAIRSIEGDIEEWRGKCASLDQALSKTMFAEATKELAMKLTALKSLYLIETGSEWEG